LVEHVPAVPVETPVDPTGAGDSYAVAYLAARLRGADPVEAGRFAAQTVAALLAGDGSEEAGSAAAPVRGEAGSQGVEEAGRSGAREAGGREQSPRSEGSTLPT
jgi:sugar/nucleoside kinase (ribokinase family)